MKNLSVLMGVFDHLNKNKSKTFIEHFDSETGVITLSGNLELNVKKVTSAKDLALYIDAKEECKTQFF
jgi:hypothetical protein